MNDRIESRAQPKKFGAKEKLSWLDQIADDRDVPSLAFRIAHALARKYVNSDQWAAFMSQETLADFAGVPIGSVRRALKSLIDCGHLSRDINRGRSQVNRYRPLYKNRSGVSSFKPEKCSAEIQKLPTGEQGFSLKGNSFERGGSAHSRAPRRRSVQDGLDSLQRQIDAGCTLPPVSPI